ncbi:YdbL family protein [Sphingomonas rhizophila]|uniref:YdbL family protein n=1 Tax=Sphingomonas rhizophila TaxID=2071607 RepID=A0A7G9S8H3_9SPHN|nr:YdbL family protein [Sphingomonas rhizophila]QNN64148.1 YdbL family protein [Sphingomonas rhizophila]
MARFLAVATVAASLSLGAAPAAAQSSPAIAAARASGVVGERYDGYLGLAAGSGDNLRKIVGAVNIKRRSLYSQLAARRGVSPSEVGITAACQLFARVAVGEVYMLQDGIWRRRGPGQGAPRPDYCG